MLAIFLSIALVLLSLCFIFSIILIVNLLKKIKVYEQWILEFKDDVEDTLEEMRNIDKRGVFATSMNEKGLFESDDEVGIIFKDIQDLIEKLNEKVQ